MAAALAFAVVSAVAVPAQADWKPTEPVEIMVHSKPGSSPDVLARTIQKIWKDHNIVEQPVTVLNKATQAVGFAYLLQHKGDPHKITISSTGTISAKVLGITEIGYRDLTPVSLLMSEFTALAVPVNSPFKTGKDFVEQLKKDPSSLSIASGGARGNPNHTHVALAAKAGGVDARKLKMVIYSSGADARSAAIGGHVDAVTASAGSFIKQAQSGLLRVIAVSSDERLTGPLADVPTWKELGFDFTNANWRWGGATGGLTDDQIAYWEDVYAKTVQTDDWKDFVAKNNAESTYLDHKKTLAYFDREEKVLTELLNELDLIKKK
jgi:putative tricarboxylic transport membrane protein